MKTFLLRCLALCSATIAAASGAIDSNRFTAKELSQGYREHRLLAKPKAELRAQADVAETREGLRLRRKFQRMGDLRILELDANDTVDRAIARLRASGRYEYVERDHIYFTRATPNDPSFPQQWSLHNTGQSGGSFGADIRAVSGWDTLAHAASVTVAVIDSGVRLTHQDLAANLWTSPTGKHGINALFPSNSFNYTNPDDDSGHGTHVAGIVGAVGNNGLGISGVAWSVKLMALKFINSSGTGSASDSVECIDYAVANGAKIINASFGSFGNSSAQLEAIRAARNAGVIFVAAAGNETNNNDVLVDYPSGYPLDNIVSVASTTRTDVLAPSSSYGSGSVELAAPGAEILSTYHNSDSSYQVLSGTSMAAPHVAGALALLKAKFPNDTYRQLINRLLRSTDRLGSLEGKVQTGGRLNLARALSSTSHRPFNDGFGESALVGGPNIRIRSNNADATVDPGEPAHAGVSNGASLWWTWTAKDTSSVGFDTAGSSYDTVLAVYTGSSLGALQPVAANDNATASAITSRVVFTATAGTTYRIAVAGKNGVTGYTALKIGAVPPHDDFANAKALSGRSVKETATLLNASRQFGEPNPFGQSAGHSIWYRWTAPTSGPYSLAAFATAVDTLAAVYTGASVGSLSLVAANDNNAGGQNTDALVSFDATAGTTYYLQIDHTNDSSSPEGGDLTLTLTDSLWEFPAQDEITSSPAVADNGVVYVGSVDGRVYAINPDGSQKWQFPAANVTEVGDFDGASPAIGPDGTVYIGCLDNHLYALDGATGAKKWSYAGSTPSYSAPAIAADGTIYHRDQSKLYALTPAGTLKWSFELNPANVEGTYCSPVIGTDGTLYIGTSGGAFFALRDTGTSATVKWTFTADGDIYTSPAIAADGTLYFGTLAGKFYAITPGVSSAVQKWSLSLPKFNGLDNSISSSPALGGDGTIYFAAYDHKLYAVNPATGAIKWSYTLGDEVRASSPAVAADGTVFVGAYDGLLYAVGPDGVLRRTYPTALRIRSSPTIAGTRLYFGSADAKLHAFDLGQSLVSSPWPMFHRNPAHDGRATSGLTITAQPQSQSAGVGGSVTLTAAASGTVPPAYQWQRNGAPVSGATASTLTLSNLQPRDAGVYAAVITSGTSVTSAAAIVGVSSSVKVVGTGTELQPANITHPNGNVFDQVLLTGEAAAITAEHAAGQITRMSFIDVDEDIVQVEFSGPGTLSLVLDSPSANAASPVNYNQPGVSYRKGHAGIVITGATDQTNVSVFTVGRATAFDPTGRYNILLPPSATNDPAANGSPLFQGRAATAYDGVADVSFIAISSANGKFGGIRTSNAHYFASKGFTGIYAPGVAFQGPVFIGDIIAFDSAKPVLVLGSVTDARITGGDLLQTNGEPVQVSGLSQLKFTAGSDSHGRGLPAQPNRGVLQQDGANVTAQIVVNPAP